jgi:hypothetical protein
LPDFVSIFPSSRDSKPTDNTTCDCHAPYCHHRRTSAVVTSAVVMAAACGVMHSLTIVSGECLGNENSGWERRAVSI